VEDNRFEVADVSEQKALTTLEARKKTELRAPILSKTQPKCATNNEGKAVVEAETLS
jgi:hypothetical protein